MPAIRRILVAIKDIQAPSQPVVLKAAQIARACNAKVQLFHALATPLYADVSSLDDRSLEPLEHELRRRALSRLEVIAEQLRKHSIRVTVTADWDFPSYEAIIRQALRGKADLIVASRHSGRHTAPWLLRLTDWELLRQSPTPVLLVKNPHAYRHPPVLAAIDPAHTHAKPLLLDREILRTARMISQALNGKLNAVHAYARAPIGNVYGAVPREAVKSGLMTPGLFKKMEQKMQRLALRSAEASLTRALRGTRIAAARRYVIASDPVHAIVEAAQQSKSAIVVMGAVSRSGLRRLLIGNTAERVLDELSCDVLVVKPPKFPCKVPRTANGPKVLMLTPAGGAGYY
ncbi:MAG: universal stress protein [Steroidobacteraceae bacterium]|jgi:universal stress protein E